MRISDWSSDVCSSDLNAVPTEWRGSQISGLYRYPTNKILDPIKRRLHSVPKSAAAGPDGWRMRRVADNGQNGNEHAVRADRGQAHRRRLRGGGARDRPVATDGRRHLR